MDASHLLMYMHTCIVLAFMLVSLVFFPLQNPKPGRRSWSRWRPSLSLAMLCPWPVCSWLEPVETLCCSVSKMPRYDRLSYGIKNRTTQNSFQTNPDCISPPTSFLLWSTIQGRTTWRHCLFIILRSRSSEYAVLLFFWIVILPPVNVSFLSPYRCTNERTIIVLFTVFAGRFCAKCAYPHCSRGPRESLCCDARLRHQACRAAVQEGHPYWWAGGGSRRRVCWDVSSFLHKVLAVKCSFTSMV